MFSHYSFNKNNHEPVDLVVTHTFLEDSASEEDATRDTNIDTWHLKYSDSAEFGEVDDVTNADEDPLMQSQQSSPVKTLSDATTQEKSGSSNSK